MRKRLVICLALVFLLGITGTAFAGAFADVAANHWAYGAINKLVKAGVIDGYGDGTFRGDKVMTRYEMAQIVARAMEHSDKADAENKALINKLAEEFAKELDNLGVRVAALEKKSSPIKLTGDFYTRWQQNFDLDGFRSGSTDVRANDRFQYRFRLGMAADLNDKTSFYGRFQVRNRVCVNNTGNGACEARNDQPDLDLAYVTFKDFPAGANLMLGRQNFACAYGKLIGVDYFDAARVTFGNKLRGWMAYGDDRFASGPSETDAQAHKADERALFAVNLTYDVDKNFNLTGGTVQSMSNASQMNMNNRNYKLMFVGAKYLLDDFTVFGEFYNNSHSSVTSEKKALYGRVQWKGATAAAPGSWGLWVDYRDIGSNSVPQCFTGLDTGGKKLLTDGYGLKGFAYGFNNTISKNVILMGELQKLSSYNGNIKYDDFITVRIDYLF